MKPLMSYFERELAYSLPKISIHFREIGLQPEFYAYRWLLLFFAQEFNIADVTR